MRWILPIIALCLLAGCGETDPPPVDLLVTNARLVTGTGEVVPRGAISIRAGRIEAISEGDGVGTAERVVDAGGRTVLPGLIDTHRHILVWSFARSEADLQSYMETELPAVLEGLLDAGLTTVMSPADFVPEIFEVRRRLSEGDLRGPRLIAAGRAFTGPGGHPAGSQVCNGNQFCRSGCTVEVDDPDLVRIEVKKDVEMGADFIKVIIDPYIVPDTVIDDTVVEAIASESESLGVPLLVHAGTGDMVRAIEMGADALVHSPLDSVEDSGLAALLVQHGIPVATTVSWHTPEFASAVGQPWNEDEYRQQLDSIRYLVDNGVVVAFGTDNPPPLGLTEFMYEVEALGTVLTPREVVESMTIQAARFLGVEDRFGTLEAGKVADLVLVDGDPLEDLAALGNVVMVVKGGTVVVDTR